MQVIITKSSSNEVKESIKKFYNIAFKFKEENLSTSSDESNDHNEICLVYTNQGGAESTNLFSRTEDVFESAVIGANNLAVSGDIENSCTEGDL